MAKRINDTVTIRDTRLLFRNFEGRKEKFNTTGKRQFCVVIPDFEVAEQMQRDGWNIKWLEPRGEVEAGEDEQATPYLKVNVSYLNRPPRVVQLTSKGRTELTEDLVEMMDYADITKTDIIISPYNYNVDGSEGVSAYLKTLVVTINEDELELEIAGIPLASGSKKHQSDEDTDRTDELLD